MVAVQGTARLGAEGGEPLGQDFLFVFLIHYAVALAVSAFITHWWPQSVAWNAAGMLMALVLSLLAGVLLHRGVEQKSQDWRHWLFWVGVFMASSAVAMHWSSAWAQA